MESPHCLQSVRYSPISTVATECEYHDIISQFKDLTLLPVFDEELVQSTRVQHYITTEGLPVFAKVRLLNTEALATAKDEFGCSKREYANRAAAAGHRHTI